MHSLNRIHLFINPEKSHRDSSLFGLSFSRLSALGRKYCLAKSEVEGTCLIFWILWPVFPNTKSITFKYLLRNVYLNTHTHTHRRARAVPRIKPVDRARSNFVSH